MLEAKHQRQSKPEGVLASVYAKYFDVQQILWECRLTDLSQDMGLLVCLTPRFLGAVG